MSIATRIRAFAVGRLADLPPVLIPFGVARGARLSATRGVRAALGLYELEIARYLRAFVEADTICFDVGAGHGYYSLALARYANAGAVVAFEPASGCYSDLLATLQLNPALAARILPVPLALGRVPGDGMSSVDSYVTQHPDQKPGLMKIDVDGPEAEVIAGALETIQDQRPRFLIETHGYAVEATCLKMLADSGYAYRVLDARRFLPEHRPIEVNRWVVAVHREDRRADIVMPHRAKPRQVHAAL